MIQFNLLPDVKLEYVKAQRTKHTVISAALISAGSAFVIFLLLFLAVNVVQKTSIGNLDDDVKKYSTELKATPDLDKILTIQNQLTVLPGLHAAKPAVTQTFSYLQQVTPAAVSLTEVDVDYEAHTFSIQGTAATLDQVNTYADTLKFTAYKIADGEPADAFSDVVLSEFSRTPTGSTFTITASYQPDIFDNTKTVTLSVPEKVSTRSVLQQPLFTTTNGKTN